MKGAPSPALQHDVDPHGTFSDEFEQWIGNGEPKSLGDLGEVFSEKSFAVAIIVLMLVSAVPLPTGGVGLAFQLMAIFLAAQMVLGRRTIWLPARWRRHRLDHIAENRAVRFVLGRIRWLEKYSRPRGAALFCNRLFMRLVGATLMALAVAAALAPPLSGLETLPAVGAIVIALAIILDDVVLLVAGVLIGAAGVALFVSVGAAIVRVVRRLV